ncbi:hypothetical protein VUR80DRAFT_9008 [Thermomyces stellatus]
MRLINTTTLQLRFFASNEPPYAILSHTWGEEEVLFQDMKDGPERAARLKGFAKIRNCCRQAVRDGYEWAWVDTCCIDKTSSSELSEAINSMYRWYKFSAVCYVWMEDVEAAPNALATDPASAAGTQPPGAARRSLGYEFSRSRWFRRGWTLQELIAPRCVEFYDKNWREIGTKSSLATELRRITGIRAEVLAGGPMTRCCMAERMSWAANRETTKPEDRAYSLLGIFDVNMPLLYGEGWRAFIRFQEEVLRKYDDLSLLAWNIRRDIPEHESVLAPHPNRFTPVLATHNAPLVRDGKSPKRIQQGITWENVRRVPLTRFEAPSITSRGILVTLFVDTPASHNLRLTPDGVLVWTNLVAEFGNRNEPPISLCMLMQPQSRVTGPISNMPDYVTLERPYSFRKLGIICIPQSAVESFIPKRFYLPTYVGPEEPKTEWVVRQPWTLEGVPRPLLEDPGYESDSNILTLRLEPTSGLTLEQHHPKQLRRAEIGPGVHSFLIPAGPAAASMSREVLLSCSRHRRNPGGKMVVDKFALYFVAMTRNDTNQLLFGCSILRWAAEVDKKGLTSQIVRDLERTQSTLGFPLGDRAHLHLEDGAVVAAVVKQHVQWIEGMKSFVNVSLIVSVTESGFSWAS